MAYRMECFRKAVIAGDTCPEGAIYMPVLYQAMALHSFSSPSERFLAHPPAPVYNFIFTPGLCRSDMGVFLALRTRIFLFRPLFGGGPSAGTAQSLLRHLYTLMCVCDVCVFYGYASTKTVFEGQFFSHRWCT